VTPDCIQLAQDMAQWRTFVNTVMNILVRYKRRGISWAAEQLLASERRPYSRQTDFYLHESEQ
jgi:hypothetical protein